MHPLILAIESSCDETSAAVISQGKVLNNVVASQSVHHKYGGVVPELASRAHQRNIVEVVHEAVSSAGISVSNLDAIGFTRGPGLMGSLLVGTSFAKGMAVALGIPLIEVDHLQAHVLSHFIGDRHPGFPFLCLTVSGGHTQLVLVRDFTSMTIIGQTRDDAVGEAFDKAAKMMGLSYPGGPRIDALARQGNPTRFRFSETVMPGLDFSFSGIKTAFLYFLRDEKTKDPLFVEKNLPDLCASLQAHLVGMLLQRLTKAANETGIREVALAGGVSANSGLRSALQDLARSLGWTVFIPDVQYCTDNAAMVAMAAHVKFLRKEYSDLSVAPVPNLAMNG
jgi:N6-L-threonylcarbamoyladenine synthase